MDEAKLAFERQQLVDTWARTFSKGWMKKPKADVRHLINPSTEKFGGHFRQVHNVFGWKAGDGLEDSGLCSGAIYRSRRFLELEQHERNGSVGTGKRYKHLKTVHIEHTVPASVLNRLWKLFRDPDGFDLEMAYAWTLVHSVSTAVHTAEEKHLGKYNSETDAFDRTSPDFGLPFMRYVSAGLDIEVWNVVTGKRIDPKTWTFADHWDCVDALFDEAGCDVEEATAVRAKAATLLPRFTGPAPLAA